MSLTLQQTNTGRGVKAKQMFAKHATICQYKGLVTKNLTGELEPYLLQIAPELYLRPKKLPSPYNTDDLPWFVNHSCNPNSRIEIHGKEAALIAIRTIVPGEQITFDYSVSQVDPWAMICMCGSYNCRDVVGQASILPFYIKLKYLMNKTFPSYVIKTLFK